MSVKGENRCRKRERYGTKGETQTLSRPKGEIQCRATPQIDIWLRFCSVVGLKTVRNAVPKVRACVVNDHDSAQR
jgi:hypothetical protein